MSTGKSDEEGPEEPGPRERQTLLANGPPQPQPEPSAPSLPTRLPLEPVYQPMNPLRRRSLTLPFATLNSTGFSQAKPSRARRPGGEVGRGAWWREDGWGPKGLEEAAAAGPGMLA
ncbi:hypothetical protein CROQUDRAFT_105419 [Cronartium quercuum f. sp. fusiforme G11]|uniref:Uncharacterized protein n=1 Tax=Cronartium quercuum f. sp. fusiforme G11 TaxID=708437 RepID=A0A9P6NSQ8_9BASI|nr:hypothetical protein CROQUDRAFT_105419 [Cronartium quercuum f. sp. fusiforme G11]